MKHVRILERLVVAFCHGQDHDLVRLAQIERRRAHEVAHVLDQQQAVVAGHELRKRVRDHLRVQMTALAGVDLHCSRAGLAHAIGVARRLLVALDDGDGRSSLPRARWFSPAASSSLIRGSGRDSAQTHRDLPRSVGSPLRSHRSSRAGRARPEDARARRGRRRPCRAPRPPRMRGGRARTARPAAVPLRAKAPARRTQRVQKAPDRFALDPRFGVTATAGRAHHASPSMPDPARPGARRHLDFVHAHRIAIRDAS